MKPRKNKGGGKSVYDESLKIAVARDYLTGNLSHAQLAEKYNIAGGRDAVRWFVKWYQANYQLELGITSNSPPVPHSKISDNKQSKSIKELEKQLSEANLKIAALEIMIQVAEEDLGIEIRKKPGTKQ